MTQQPPTTPPIAPSSLSVIATSQTNINPLLEGMEFIMNAYRESCIDEDVQIGQDVTIGKFCIIEVKRCNVEFNPPIN